MEEESQLDSVSTSSTMPLLPPLAPSLSAFLLLPRALLLSALQTLSFFLFYTFLRLFFPLPLEILLMLLAWTATLILIALTVVTHIFRDALGDAPKLAFRLFIVSSISEGVAFMLGFFYYPEFICLFLAISLCAQSVLCAFASVLPADLVKEYGPRVIIWTLIVQTTVVLLAFPYCLSYWIVPAALLDSLFLIVGLDEAVRVTKEKGTRWRIAGKCALFIQTRKLSAPILLIPRVYRSYLEDFLPVGDDY